MGEKHNQAALTEALYAKANEHELRVNKLRCAMLAKALNLYSEVVLPTSLVAEIHLGYDPRARYFHILTLLTENWRPGFPGPTNSADEQRHRTISQAKHKVWTTYTSLPIDFHLVSPHRLPLLSPDEILKRLVSPDIVSLGLVPLDDARTT